MVNSMPKTGVMNATGDPLRLFASLDILEERAAVANTNENTTRSRRRAFVLSIATAKVAVTGATEKHYALPSAVFSATVKTAVNNNRERATLDANKNAQPFAMKLPDPN